MKWKLFVMAMVLATVGKVYAFVPGRDVQPVSISSGSGTVTLEAGTANIGDVDIASITDSTVSESVVVLTLTAADTEYSYTLPATATYFFARESTGAITIRYAIVAAQTADGGAYQELYAKEGKESPNRVGDKLGAKTLYFRDKSNAGTKVIIEFWTK